MNGILRWLLQVVTLPLRALLSAPARVLSGSRRLAGMSLPFQVAVLTLLVLLVSVAVTVVLFCRMNNVTFREAKLNFAFWATTSILVFLIPLVLYKALSLWLEGPSSPYPDIDQAWKAGLREMQRKGLNLHQIPLFLVVGSTSEQQRTGNFPVRGQGIPCHGRAAGRCQPALVRGSRRRVCRRQPGMLSERAGPR